MVAPAFPAGRFQCSSHLSVNLLVHPGYKVVSLLFFPFSLNFEKLCSTYVSTALLEKIGPLLEPVGAESVCVCAKYVIRIYLCGFRCSCLRVLAEHL